MRSALVAMLAATLLGCTPSREELLRYGYIPEGPNCKDVRIWEDAPGDKRPYAKRCYVGPTEQQHRPTVP